MMKYDGIECPLFHGWKQDPRAVPERPWWRAASVPRKDAKHPCDRFYRADGAYCVDVGLGAGSFVVVSDERKLSLITQDPNARWRFVTALLAMESYDARVPLPRPKYQLAQVWHDPTPGAEHTIEISVTRRDFAAFLDFERTVAGDGTVFIEQKLRVVSELQQPLPPSYVLVRGPGAPWARMDYATEATRERKEALRKALVS
jgi:hypothetical protein